MLTLTGGGTGGDSRAGTSPAKTTEDLPLPEGPITANNRRALILRQSSADSVSRPKNRSASASVQAAIQQAMSPDGFNLGANLGRVAGAGVPGHFHLHLVPRWSGDANFMTTVGETRVLPEDLADTYEALRAVLSTGY